MTESTAPSFDPYGILAALDRHRVSYIVIGALARVIHGSGEVTHAIDLVPSTRPENLERLKRALIDLGARGSSGKDLDVGTAIATDEPILELRTDRGGLKIVPTPTGTRGYDDLRRGATREPLGQGLRPAVASTGDLARMLSALGRDDDVERLGTLRHLIELEHSLRRGIGREL